MKEIRLGTIGTGSIVHSILDAVKLNDGICLKAVYSRDREKGTVLAREYGADKVFTDLQAYLEDPDLDCIYIASPNSLHGKYIEQALLSGKHVICEKPMCANASKIEELKTLAKEKGLFLIDATPTSYLPNFSVLQQMLPKIGRIRLVLCNYSQYSSRYDRFREALKEKKETEIPNVFHPAFSGGSLMDINYYNVYFACLLFGKPLSAVYYPNLAALPQKEMIDTSGLMILRYPDFLFSGAGAKDTWGVNYAQIEGEDGYLYVKEGTNGIVSVRIVTKEEDHTYDLQDMTVPGPTNRYYYEIREIVRLMLEKNTKEFERRLSVTIDTIEVIEEARKSAGIHFPEDEWNEPGS